MNDSGAYFAADTGKILDTVHYRVDESAARVARGGVDDHADGLIDNGDVRILINDVKGNILGYQLGYGRGRKGDADFVPLAETASGLGGFSVHGDEPVPYQPLHGRTAKLRFRSDVAVGARLRRRNGKEITLLLKPIGVILRADGAIILHRFRFLRCFLRFCPSLRARRPAQSFYSPSCEPCAPRISFYPLHPWPLGIPCRILRKSARLQG